MVANICFEAVVTTTTKKTSFYQRMIEFINLLESNNKKYQTNGTVRVKIRGKVIIYHERLCVIWNRSSINVLYANQTIKR